MEARQRRGARNCALELCAEYLRGASAHLWLRLGGDQHDAEGEREQRAPLAHVERAAEERDRERRRREHLELGGDGESGGVYPGEGDEGEEVHREIDDRGHRHLERAAEQVGVLRERRP